MFFEKEIMEISINNIVREDINICQPIKGFRFSVDSVYLAWFVRFKKKSKIIEIGAGSGVVSTLLAKIKRFDNICAVEYQKNMFHCLNETIEKNKLNDVIVPVESDIKLYKPDAEFDIAVCNPPYRNPSSGRVPADETELNARFTSTMCADDVFEFCKRYLSNSGSLYLSYDADLMQDLFESAVSKGFEAKRLIPVCPDINVRPKIILIEFRKNVGREMIFEAPLYQKINGMQSEQDKNIMQGEWRD